MSESTGVSDITLRKIAEKRVNFKSSVKIHAAIYLCGNIGLFILNLLNMTRIWFVYPLFGWFVGVAMHAVAYSLYTHGVTSSAKAGLIYHLTAYVTGMPLLFVINLVTSWTFWWFLIPLFLWPAGLVFHYILYRVYFKTDSTDKSRVKSRKEKAIEKEFEKMKKQQEKVN
ncbi:MAG: 2TM domain-containing protein [Candidatus Hodarchaeota archaeon]